MGINRSLNLILSPVRQSFTYAEETVIARSGATKQSQAFESISVMRLLRFARNDKAGHIAFLPT